MLEKCIKCRRDMLEKCSKCRGDMLPSYLEKLGELARTACTLSTLGGWALVAILVCSYCSVLLLHQTWRRREVESKLPLTCV